MTPTFEADLLTRQHSWFILDVMRKDRRRNVWAALLIDVDPEIWCAGEVPKTQRVKSCWLDLGKHKTVDDAWDNAEQKVATRH